MIQQLKRTANLFYILFALIAWWVTATYIQPFLHYNFQQIAFVHDIEFFYSYANYAGGIADYIAVFISQYFAFNFFGSFLIVSVAVVQSLIALWILNFFVVNSKIQISVFCSFLLASIVMMCNYSFPYYITIRLLLSMVIAVVFVILNNKFTKLSVLFYVLLICLVLYLAGGAAAIVFGLSSLIIYSLTHKIRNTLLFSPLSILFTAILPYIAYKFIFLQSLKDLYNITIDIPPYMYQPEKWLYVYYLLLPLLLLFIILIKKTQGKGISIAAKEKSKVSFRHYISNPTFVFLIQLVICISISYTVFTALYNPQKKYKLLVEYFAENKQWNEVLENAYKIQAYDYKVNFQANRALFHIKRLGEQLFDYPQLSGVNGLFFSDNMEGSVIMPISDLYWDLGLMSESQHWAFEAQTILPNSPRILKRIAMIYLVNRNYRLAEKFLKVLNKNSLYNNWVTQHMKFIKDTSLTNSNPEIIQKRSYNPINTDIEKSAFGTLETLLQWNPTNRMAYEYLLSYSLLSSNLDQFIKYIPQYRNFKYNKMPRSWEEATTLYIATHKSLPENLKSDLVSPETMEQFRQFSKIIANNNFDFNASKPTLQSNYVNTYWFYEFYLSPKNNQ